MRKTNSPRRKSAEDRRKADDLERKKEAWNKYERRIRRANSGYSELELDEY
jgi:hypothetical protein